MVNLKNQEELFGHENFMESFLKNKDTDCILYSKEGVRFNIHKEILFQTKLMQNIMISGHCVCYQNIEIICPCSDYELETILNLLYNGPTYFNEKSDVAEIMWNLTNKKCI